MKNGRDSWNYGRTDMTVNVLRFFSIVVHNARDTLDSGWIYLASEPMNGLTANYYDELCCCWGFANIKVLSQASRLTF